jgi:hypothetical protein
MKGVFELIKNLSALSVINWNQSYFRRVESRSIRSDRITRLVATKNKIYSKRFNNNVTLSNKVDFFITIKLSIYHWTKFLSIIF